MPTITHLPIATALPALHTALNAHTAVVLHAPPGAGKSTAVPLALLDEPWLHNKKIIMLEPRRLATRTVAQRMAVTLSEPVGQTVGYRTRLESKVSKNTRIEVVTEGILTRMLQRDAALEDCALIIFDEFHERSVQADLGLALCLDVQANIRADLKLLLMSATLDDVALAEFLSAPVVRAEGQLFPVTTHYRKRSAASTTQGNIHDLALSVCQCILRVLQEAHGDILVFLPGQGEIKRAQRLLLEQPLPTQVHLCPLYGELSLAEQDAALQPSTTGTKIVLATNLAETSLTIAGITVVIDAGFERRARFDPVTGMSRLETVRISRASADQRRGRAGRTQAGVCYRLWSETEQAALAAQTPAEITEADLAPVALELAQWGVQAPQALRWLDSPPIAAFMQARDLLHLLGALDTDGKITTQGRAMAALSTHPRLAHMLLRAKQLGVPQLGALLAAILSERDILRAVAHNMRGNADLRARLQALCGDVPAGMAVDAASQQRVLRSANAFLRVLEVPQSLDLIAANDATNLGLLLISAYPERIACARGEAGRYLLASGRGALLQTAHTLSGAAFIVAAALDAGEREARILLAAPLSQAVIEQECSAAITVRTQIAWDTREQAVLARRERALGAIVLATHNIEQPDVEQVRIALLAGIREQGLSLLPWNAAAHTLLARLRFVRRIDTQPIEPWPAAEETDLLAQLDNWLGPWVAGITRSTQLARLDLVEILQAQLSWAQRQRLEQLAPSHLTVPSGSRILVDYSTPTPTLAVRLQEIFGLTTTPRVGDGKVAVLLELLSPARRPVQVTQDLASFWAHGYHEVKKDLKGRYPKHHWPDDPTQAKATSHAKRRS